MDKKLVMLMILDGFGINPKKEGNAIALAKIPNIDKIRVENPTTTIRTDGLNVGLPEGQMGNSEVGHLNIGSGRVIYQETTRIEKEIDEQTFFQNKVLLEAIENCKKNNSTLHLMGLVSAGGVHANTKHLLALLELAKKQNFSNVLIHFFSDGRDTAMTSGKGYAEELERKIQEIGVGKIASVIGRYYSMDRDNRWERVKKAYDMLVSKVAEEFDSVLEIFDKNYEKKIYDEFIEPSVVNDFKPIIDNDSVIFFNFRHDRARELTRAFVDKDFKGFETIDFKNLYYVCMTEYDSTMPNIHIAFGPEEIKNTFGEYVSSVGMTQLRIAETEKYPHVTFFFNGGVEKPYEGEDRIIIPSPKVATYDLQPEMSIGEVTENVINAIDSKKYDFIILNFANPDMVGHTGNLPAAIKAVEAVDDSVGKVMQAIERTNGTILITADHGNIEQMINYETGEPHTAHTTYPVNLTIVGEGNIELKNGVLADLIPTMLDIKGLEIPKEMTGKSLIVK